MCSDNSACGIVSKGMPTNSFVDPGAQCGWANDLLQYGIGPERILPLSTRARKYPVVGLPIPAGCGDGAAS